MKLYTKRGIALPLVMCLAGLMLMFALMVMVAQRQTQTKVKKINKNLKAEFLAKGGVQHTLLKIKELREEFYDALKWAYHIQNDKLVLHTSGKFTHPATGVLIDAKATSADQAMKYLDVFKMDICSQSRGNSGNDIDKVYPNAYGKDVFTDNIQCGTIPAEPWVDKKNHGDPFTGWYQLVRNVDLEGKVSETAGANVGADRGSGTLNPAPAAPGKLGEGLIRFSTRILNTGDVNDPSDDTEEDSIQIIIVAEEMGDEIGSGGTGKPVRIVYNKIEKITRRRGL